MSAPAGWYDDGSGQQRWWDGRAWGVYAQDVSSVPGDPGAAGYGQVAGSVGQPAKSSGVFNALGQAVKNAAVERITAGQRERQQRAEREWEQRRRYEERIQEERRRREEVERKVGRRVTGGVFGTSTIEIYENGYVRVAGPGDGVTVKSVRGSTPYERLISISMERSAGGVSSSAASGAEAAAMAGTAVKWVSTVAKGGVGAYEDVWWSRSCCHWRRSTSQNDDRKVCSDDCNRQENTHFDKSSENSRCPYR